MPVTAGDPSCGGMRSSTTAVGNCHTVIYTPLAPGTPIESPPGATAQGWAGVLWQYPANNWGTQSGYAIPAGAMKVTFMAKGAAGGEKVIFSVGGINGAAVPCDDPLSASASVVLTTTWSQYSIALTTTYAPAVVTGFAFALANQGDAGSTGPQVTFYVDDIQWQQ
jgi:hypothetical protein